MSNLTEINRKNCRLILAAFIEMQEITVEKVAKKMGC